MTIDARTIILDRIALLKHELDVISALVTATAAREALAPVTTPAAAEAPRQAAPAPAPVARAEEELPAEPGEPPTGGDIGPAEATELLGVARQTVDRRLKEGRTNVPGAPADISRGAVRARWRWGSPEQVRRWWEAVK